MKSLKGSSSILPWEIYKSELVFEVESSEGGISETFISVSLEEKMMRSLKIRFMQVLSVVFED